MKEVIAVFLTGALHLVFEEILQQKTLFILLAASSWIAYLGRRLRTDPTALTVWGFRRDNLREASVAPTVFAVIAVAALAAAAGLRGTLSFHWHMLPLFALYPIWGVIQQFLVQALVAGNLQRSSTLLRSPWRITPIAAALFGIVH